MAVRPPGAAKALEVEAQEVVEEEMKVCEECWAIASGRAASTSGFILDWYQDVLEERKDICKEYRKLKESTVVEGRDEDTD